MVFAIDKFALLKQYFGHGKFRPGQEALIDALLSGRDVLGVMPTGAGKSICYQLPALLLPGLTLVISPLISLMKDQVTALSQIRISLAAAQYREVFRRAKSGAYKIIYVAPERLITADFLQFAGETEISLLAVDEAHCVSQWGQDFRPSYLKIAEFVGSLAKRPVVGAFTATATATVKTDIEKLLLLQNPLRITTGFDRPNLYFEVVRPKSKDVYLRVFLAGRPDQSGIVYCATRKAVESVCDNLRQNGIAATRYHAGLEDAERKQNQEDFVYDRARVMVATNAFGMGIDKSNVSFVVHYNMPKNIESYYQEAGRAGRDGEKACCVLLFSAGDIQTAKFLINNAEGNEALSEHEQELVRKRELQRLEQMVAYCKTADCLRAYLLNYFGENAAANCGNCGNCGGKAVQQDITVEAQKILSAVARVEKKYTSSLGLTLIIRMLHGSKEQRILQLGLDELSTYGIMQVASSNCRSV
jgi:ATP-dependent DNA helicase RecQ